MSFQILIFISTKCLWSKLIPELFICLYHLCLWNFLCWYICLYKFCLWNICLKHHCFNGNLNVVTIGLHKYFYKYVLYMNKKADEPKWKTCDHHILRIGLKLIRIRIGTSKSTWKKVRIRADTIHPNFCLFK